jgi:hypothetical protein
MPFTLGKLVDGGAYADVYEGDNGFGRKFAIKLVRPSAGDTAFILEQAKALSRVHSPYVVQVVTIEECIDPDSGQPVDGIVMEWAEGDRFDKVVRGELLSLDNARRIGAALIEGVRAIHAESIAHGDLHDANVIVGPNTVTIIDILYYDSLKAQSPDSREARLLRDRRDLRSLLVSTLTHSPAHARVPAFNRALVHEATLDQIRVAFDTAAAPPTGVDLATRVDTSIGRLHDKYFVAGDEYAAILSDEVLDSDVAAVIESMIEKSVTIDRYRPFLRQLWSRLDEAGRQNVANRLGDSIDLTLTTHGYNPHLTMLSEFGEDCWNLMGARTKLRLENAITDDVRTGTYRVAQGFGSGQLGYWAIHLHPFFAHPENLLEKILDVLRIREYDRQNYIGGFFLPTLGHLATRFDKKDVAIERLKGAVANNSRVVIKNIRALPSDWIPDILSGPQAPQGH